MKTLFAAASAVALLVAAPAFAQTASAPALNGSIGYTVVDGGDDDDFSLGAITARIGADFTPNLGVEGEVGFGVKDEDIDTAFGDVNVELKNHLGAYVVGKLPLSPQAELFARLGYANFDIEASGLGASVEEDFGGVSYGVGGTYFFDGVNGIRGDYTRTDSDDADIDVFSVSYVRRFR